MRLKNIALLGTGVFVFGGLLAGAGYLSGGAKQSVVWDHGFKTEKIEKSEKIFSGDVKDLSFDLENTNVTIERGAKFSLKATYLDRSKPAAYVENGKLVIVAESRTPSLNIGFTLAQPNIILTIPENIKLDTIDIKDSNGSVEMKDIDASVSTIISTSNSDVKIVNGNLGKLQVNTSNDDIELVNIKASTGTLHTSNGTINLDKVEFSGITDFSNSSGSIEYSESKFSAEHTSTTSNGSIEAEDTDFSGPNSFASSNASIELENGKLDGKSTIKTSNGHVGLDGTTVDGVNATVSLGKIRVFGKTSSSQVTRNPGATNTVTIHNSNGNINVE